MKRNLQMATAGIPTAGRKTKFLGFKYKGGNRPKGTAKFVPVVQYNTRGTETGRITAAEMAESNFPKSAEVQAVEEQTEAAVA